MIDEDGDERAEETGGQRVKHPHSLTAKRIRPRCGGHDQDVLFCCSDKRPSNDRQEVSVRSGVSRDPLT